MQSNEGILLNPICKKLQKIRMKIIVLLFSISSIFAICPCGDWEEVEESFCIHLNTNKVSWTKAIGNCEEDGGFLCTVEQYIEASLYGDFNLENRYWAFPDVTFPLDVSDNHFQAPLVCSKGDFAVLSAPISGDEHHRYACCIETVTPVSGCPGWNGCYGDPGPCTCSDCRQHYPDGAAICEQDHSDCLTCSCDSDCAAAGFPGYVCAQCNLCLDQTPNNVGTFCLLQC